MKKLYIYILIGLLCFLGFSGEVEAEYKAICKYKYSDTYNSNSSSRKIVDAELLYDANQSKPYKLTVTLTAEKIDYDNEEENLSKYSQQSYTFKSIGAQDNVIGGNHVFYSHNGLSSNSCPSSLIINAPQNEFCFYNSSTGKDWCKKEMNNSSGYIFSGSKIAEENYDNVNDGAVCNKSVGTDGESGQSFAYLSFINENGSLKIQYKTDENGEVQTVTGSKIVINSSSSNPSGNINKSYTKNIYLTNANADLHSEGVVLSTRSDFDRAYLKEWNETGSCPVLKIDVNGDKSSSNASGTIRNYWLLLPDAVADVEQYGSSKIDSEDFVDLKDWGYNWKNWFDLRNEYNDCEGLLGDDIMDLLDEIFLYVKILIPVALIGFGIVDFVKAVFSSKEDDMKKAQNRFIKRLIIAAIIFILPSIVNALLQTIDGIWAHINNSACNIWD